LQSGTERESLLVCLPGAGASAASFVDLVASMDRSQAIWGLESRGLDGLLLPHRSVGAAATCCLEQLERCWSAASIHLLGHSFGGWIAFEIASRLRAAGRAVGSLTVLDSESPQASDDRPEYDVVDVSLAWFEMCELTLGRTLGVTRADLEPLDQAGQRALLHRVLVREGLLPSRTDPDVLLGPLRVFGAALRTPYTPETIYDDPVQLILVDDPRLTTAENRARHTQIAEDWRRWAPKLTWTHTPGNHVTVLKPPHAATLARVLPFA